MTLAVDGTTQEGVAKLRHHIERSDSGWSDWDILEDPVFCELRGRVEVLEEGTATGPVEDTTAPMEAQLDEALERIADLEGKVLGGYIGGVPRLPQQQRGRATTSPWAPRPSWPSAP